MAVMSISLLKKAYKRIEELEKENKTEVENGRTND
jgi:hypothetical protein